MNYPKILKSLEKKESRNYTPEFSIKPGKRCFHIYDGNTAVVDFYVPDENTPGERYMLDIFKFSPFENAVIANHPSADCKVVDMHTLKNSCITFPYFYSKDLIAGMDNYHSSVTMEWMSGKGDKLLAVISGEFSEGQRMRYEFTIDYDPVGQRYRFLFDIDFWKLAPMGFEPLNFLMAGALRGRKELTRWTHSIYEDRFNVLRKLVHSNALFCTTDYSEPPYWRQKSAPLQKAWIAYGCNKTCNPAFLIHNNNAPLRLDTCSALFDEHIRFGDATNENLDENYFHFSMKAEFVNLDYEITKELFDNAKSQPMPKKWRINKVALPLEMDIENDLEVPVDISEPESCPILTVETELDAPAQWAEGIAYKGQHCIKLQGKNLSGWTELYPEGAVCEVEPNTRYRFSAMVKTEGVERLARIALAIFEYHPYIRPDIHYSESLCKETGWTYLEAVMESGDSPYMLPILQLYGIGNVWFDCLKFEKE